FAVLHQILAMARASYHRQDNKHGVIWEHEQTHQKQLFTPRNSWDFSGVRGFPAIPDAWRVKYLDPDAGWEQNEAIVYRSGYGADSAKTFDTLDLSYGITNRDQARRMALEKFRELQLRPEQFLLTTDIEYLVAQRGDRVGYQYDTVKVGLGSARITAIDGR